MERFDRLLADAEQLVFCGSANASPLFLAARRSSWDRDHFGFGVATIGWVHAHADDCRLLAKLLDDCLERLRAEGVRFVSARMPGDLLPAIHLFEDRGFRFYENLLWAAGRLDEPAAEAGDSAVRLMAESDLTRVVEIASEHQYQRGHFHCDPGLDRRLADRLYAKWIETSWRNGEPIAVAEHEGRVVGYFNFRMADGLSRAMGCTYGRLRSLALDSSARGLGLGAELMRGVLRLIAQFGGDHADSAFATKNHMSARLHQRSGLYPVHEEVTLHLWL